jgi:hypothetical protein
MSVIGILQVFSRDDRLGASTRFVSSRLALYEGSQNVYDDARKNPLIQVPLGPDHQFENRKHPHRSHNSCPSPERADSSLRPSQTYWYQPSRQKPTHKDFHTKIHVSEGAFVFSQLTPHFLLQSANAQGY